MKHALPPLESLKAFEAAARHLSFSKAADELCISKGAISYQVRKLEENIDCTLFKRSIRQVYLTDAGQKLLQTTTRLFDEMAQTINQLAHTDNELNVSVAATTYVALRWLSPRITAFNQRYPNVSIVFKHSVNSDEFNLQDVDIALSWCRCDGSNSRHHIKQMPLPLFPVCSPELLAKIQLRPHNEKLAINHFSSAAFESVPLLCEDRRLDTWQHWYGENSPELKNPRRLITDANVRTQAAIDGQGWTMADALMQQELENGSLVAPFAHQLEGYGYALMASPNRHMNHKVKALRDWLIQDLV